MFGSKLKSLVKSLTRELKQEKELNETYRERNKQLEEDLAKYKDIELKYRITKMLLEDDEAIDEMLAVHAENKKAENTTNICYECEKRKHQRMVNADLALQQHMAHNDVLRQQMEAARQMHHGGLSGKMSSPYGRGY